MANVYSCYLVVVRNNGSHCSEGMKEDEDREGEEEDGDKREVEGEREEEKAGRDGEEEKKNNMRLHLGSRTASVIDY